MTSLRSLAGVLTALVWLGACASDDAMDTNAGTETATETDSTGDGDGDGDGDGECTPPPGVFGDCGPGTDACMTDGPKLCVVDNQNAPSIAVCGRRCSDTCDCWAPPADGEAEVACSSLIPGDEGVCVLDCSGSKACPSGMICTDEVGLEVCVFQQ
ncbi:hypothetical protein [Enhygromyxa salina]|uniref:Tryptophan synthase alpha chain n=1 Tax=Enhygromyxa salina TaxID=215803 RepID=A0A2S9Y5M6_9BACT|nr:hypothetical protein [Enhygromyxa salina]PRQ00417.1 hypothetical protein ENSA7_59110 [Enhygromyxa salina]